MLCVGEVETPPLSSLSLSDSGFISIPSFWFLLSLSEVYVNIKCNVRLHGTKFFPVTVRSTFEFETSFTAATSERIGMK